MRGRPLRIASGQGFWGDDLDAPVRQVEGGPIDYLMMDYLAEVTMSIMQKQRDRDPSAGYARDFIPLMERLLPGIVDRGIRVVTNAGGVNPVGCAEALLEAADRAGVKGTVKVGMVLGDDLVPRLDELLASGHPLTNMDTGEPLERVRDRVRSANVYMGARPIVRVLGQGAQVVLTGRCADAALTYAPMIHEFGWGVGDVDRLAAGVVAGHINECGAQTSGGNTLAEWWTVPNLAEVGFPIIEAEPSGDFVVTKHEGTGGRVSTSTVAEQIVYEVGDPREYITPDVVADFTTLRLEDDGPDRVRVVGVKGRPATEFLKVSIAYSAGYRALGTLVYSWPDAPVKAKLAERVLRERLLGLGLTFDQIRAELVGWNATHGPLVGDPSPDIPEVQLRIGVRSRDRWAVERFTRELAPLVLTGPPSATGFAGGRPRVQEVMAYWPALIRREAVEPYFQGRILEGF
ncbi:MAG: acyclic terpene utilization AtuA family protein [Longimicrobiales bacterium]